MGTRPNQAPKSQGGAKALAIGLALGVIGLALPAFAQSGSDGLEPSLAVLEIHITGQDYPKTAEYALRVTDEMTKIARFSILERADATRQIGTKMTTSSRKATDDRLAEIEKLMKKGEDLLLTDPRMAIEILAEAKKMLRGVMDNLSLNEKIWKSYFDTQMLLARSHLDNGNEQKSAELLEEIIRTFGDESNVTEGEFHPRLVELYNVAARRFAKMDKGRVLVRTLPTGAEIIIQGKPRSKASPATYDGLYPGTVTVQARKGGRESMIHRVKINANSTAEVTIDIDYENSLAFHSHDDEKRFGFVFRSTNALKSQLAGFAARIGKVLRVDYILAVGLVDTEGRTNLEGFLVNVTSGKIERTETLYTKANVVSKNRVRQIAMAMSNKGYTVQRSYKPWYTNWIGWTGAVIGISGLAMGGVFMGKYNENLVSLADKHIPLPEKETVHKPNATKNRALGATGFVAAGIGITGSVLAFLFLKEEVLGDRMSHFEQVPRFRLEAIAPVIGPDRVSLGATFSF